MKRNHIGFISIGSLLGLGSLLAGCSTPEGKPEIERQFHGNWMTEYYIGNKEMRMKVTETAAFDTLSHKYKIEQVQELVSPVNIRYADVYYEGTWVADAKYFYGKIDPKTIKVELNPQFDEHPEVAVYRDIVKDEADADLSKDIFFIRKLTEDRVHLFDDDRDVAHDLIRIVPTAEDPEYDVVI